MAEVVGVVAAAVAGGFTEHSTLQGADLNDQAAKAQYENTLAQLKIQRAALARRGDFLTTQRDTKTGQIGRQKSLVTAQHDNSVAQSARAKDLLGTRKTVSTKGYNTTVAQGNRTAAELTSKRDVTTTAYQEQQASLGRQENMANYSYGEAQRKIGEWGATYKAKTAASGLQMSGSVADVAAEETNRASNDAAMVRDNALADIAGQRKVGQKQNALDILGIDNAQANLADNLSLAKDQYDLEQATIGDQEKTLEENRLMELKTFANDTATLDENLSLLNAQYNLDQADLTDQSALYDLQETAATTLRDNQIAADQADREGTLSYQIASLFGGKTSNTLDSHSQLTALEMILGGEIDYTP